MSDRFKDALNEYNSGLFEHTEGRFIQERFISNKTVYSIREALTLATEAEQLRKDKDAIKRTLDGAKVLLQINSDTIEQLRKERDEFAECAFMGATPQHLRAKAKQILEAKRIIENGNA